MTSQASVTAIQARRPREPLPRALVFACLSWLLLPLGWVILSVTFAAANGNVLDADAAGIVLGSVCLLGGIGAATVGLGIAFIHVFLAGARRRPAVWFAVSANAASLLLVATPLAGAWA